MVIRGAARTPHYLQPALRRYTEKLQPRFGHAETAQAAGVQ